jgi:hypothetical protein
VDAIDTKVLLELVKDTGSDSEWFGAGTRKEARDGSNLAVAIVGWCRTKATTATTTTTIICLLLARPRFGKQDYRGFRIDGGGGSWREYKTAGCVHE